MLDAFSGSRCRRPIGATAPIIEKNLILRQPRRLANLGGLDASRDGARVLSPWGKGRMAAQVRL
jgi:hypothetical protein